MPSDELLTGDDLDAMGHEALQAEDPSAQIAALVEAVDREQLADPADAGYALTLAAETNERQGDLTGALALIDRAVEVSGPGADSFPRSYRGLILHRLGREDEAMAQFSAVRPRLVRDADAASSLSEAMEECGSSSIAEQWLTAALETLLDRAGEPDDHGLRVLHALLRARRRIRHELGLPPDEMDETADRMRLVQNGLDPDEPDGPIGPDGPAPLFWSREEFDRVMLRWPALAEVYGRTWDEHRASIEKTLTEAEGGWWALSQGTAEGLAAYAARRGADPADPATRVGYENQQKSMPSGMPWPPARNGPCWCRSGSKYKKCCLPRSRA
ncbi:SEC-C metal-binding domain-containing protein [Actinoplanes sp. GCM10030250]|uniref:SEC-C metal-binding domain-containing protein n=1 Tax=Actinoplanes sp. GCM10030250 TaxID=3273376 RepID=UPI0036081B07